jgi:2-polyprenyl-3-methyl-5-hydroxy-6-metoxy-1,4-benzoquinol methylase
VRYIGHELDSFAVAVRWKAYVRNVLSPYIVGSVLEVGAGTGSFTEALQTCEYSEWWALEPDSRLAAQMHQRQSAGDIRAAIRLMVGTERELSTNMRFDTILYLDVLEHIMDDRGEVARAARRLRAGGRLIILAPAFQFLYSPFDQAIGHFRRYTRRTLERIRPSEVMSEVTLYLDAPGMLLSLANRVLLRSKQPTLRQVMFWDRVVIPCAEKLDLLTGRRFGRSIVVVWRKAHRRRHSIGPFPSNP